MRKVSQGSRRKSKEFHLGQVPKHTVRLEVTDEAQVHTGLSLFMLWRRLWKIPTLDEHVK